MNSQKLLKQFLNVYKFEKYALYVNSYEAMCIYRNLDILSISLNEK